MIRKTRKIDKRTEKNIKLLQEYLNKKNMKKDIIVNTVHMETEECDRFKNKLRTYFNDNVVNLYENNQSNLVIGVVQLIKLDKNENKYKVTWNKNNKREEPKGEIYFVCTSSGVEMYIDFENNIIKFPTITFSNNNDK